MKIALDISRLNPAALKRGVGFYALNLSKALSTLNDGNQYLLLTKKTDINGFDLIHYPYFDPFFLTLPIIKKLPTVVTVHDLTPIKFSQHYPQGVKGSLKWQIQRLSLKSVNHVITDSLNSKNDLNKVLNINDNKISVIYLAADKEFTQINNQVKFKEIREKFRLKGKFLLYVGDVNWNKNVLSLLKAFAFNRKENKELKLVLVGSAFENNKLMEVKKIDEFIRRNKLETSIIKTGFIDDKDLAVLYNMSTLYIQPSFYEGFGLSVLEALSCGCPVLSSNKASLPEVGGKSVAYFNPDEKNGLDINLSKLLADKKRLENLSKLGIKQARKFNWEQTAINTREVYKKIFKK
ncbi:glycosyltransferase family 4 protein [Patescibacteria group bacterium]